MSIWSQAKAAGLATPDESGASGVCESERGVNPCERYHRNGTGGVVTCACRPSSHHSNRATTLRRYQIHGRRACEREATIQSNPRPPQEKGKVFFVPRSLGRRTARPDVGSPRILATVRPPARPSALSAPILARFLIDARMCARVRVPTYTLPTWAHARVRHSSRPVHAHGYCVSFVGIFGGGRLPWSYIESARLSRVLGNAFLPSLYTRDDSSSILSCKIVPRK